MFTHSATVSFVFAKIKKSLSECGTSLKKFQTNIVGSKISSSGRQKTAAFVGLTMQSSSVGEMKYDWFF
jgi:hypothetical protein